MTSREQILADIRRQLTVDAPLPTLDGPWTRYDDPQRQFLDVLGSVGGHGQLVAGIAALRKETERIAAVTKSLRTFSAVPAATPGTVGWETIDDPHDVADVDLAIVPGELAVAENAAVWVSDAVVPQRSVYYLAQHLVLVVPAERLVHNLHEAYDWLTAAPGDSDASRFAEPMFGAFISGPSKTADIEQALVIGAHGARSLNVLLWMQH
jgi:L-lactate dehydrogenase complex protein LldG